MKIAPDPVAVLTATGLEGAARLWHRKQLRCVQRKHEADRSTQAGIHGAPRGAAIPVSLARSAR